MPEFQPSALQLPAIIDLPPMVRGYIAAMLWANTFHYDGEELKSADPAVTEQAGVTRDAIRAAVRDCKAFAAMAASDRVDPTDRSVVAGAIEWRSYPNHDALEYAGHCFALSRNGHGAGFFDSRYGAHRRLHQLAKTFGSATWILSANGNARVLE